MADFTREQIEDLRPTDDALMVADVRAADLRALCDMALHACDEPEGETPETDADCPTPETDAVYEDYLPPKNSPGRGYDNSREADIAHSRGLERRLFAALAQVEELKSARADPSVDFVSSRYTLAALDLCEKLECQLSAALAQVETLTKDRDMWLNDSAKQNAALGRVIAERDALKSAQEDVERIEAIPRFAAAIIWKPEAKLPTLGTLKDGFDSGELRAWLDDAMQAGKEKP